MIRIRGGFGGVIFGNPVTPPPGNLKVSSVRFEADAKYPDRGNLYFALSDGRTAILEGVRSESVRCAVRLLYESFGEVHPPGPDDGIGLVGIKDFVQTVIRDANGKPRKSQKQNVVLHPAFENTNLGWALIGVDALPIVSEYLVAQARKGQDEPASRALAQFWASFRGAGTWKVTDQPVTIEIRPPVKKDGASTLILHRTEPRANAGNFFLGMSTDFSDESATSLLELLANAGDGQTETEEERELRALIGDNKKDQAAVAEKRAASFDRVLPILVRYCPEYDLAEEFARILSVFRWARQAGAAAPKLPIQLPPSVPTPSAILLNPERGLVPVSSYEINEKDPMAIYRSELPGFRDAAKSVLGAEGYAIFEKALAGLGKAAREQSLIEAEVGRIADDDPAGEAKLAGLKSRFSAAKKLGEKHEKEITAVIAKLKPSDRSLVQTYVRLVLAEMGRPKREAPTSESALPQHHTEYSIANH